MVLNLAYVKIQEVERQAGALNLASKEIVDEYTALRKVHLSAMSTSKDLAGKTRGTCFRVVGMM